MENDLLKYFTIDNKNGARSIESMLKKSNIELYNNIIQWNDNMEIPFKEKIYRFINKITEVPKCRICDNKVKFTNSIIKGLVILKTPNQIIIILTQMN
jgi:hypothetical protein